MSSGPCRNIYLHGEQVDPDCRRDRWSWEDSPPGHHGGLRSMRHTPAFQAKATNQSSDRDPTGASSAGANGHHPPAGYVGLYRSHYGDAEAISLERLRSYRPCCGDGAASQSLEIGLRQT